VIDVAEQKPGKNKEQEKYGGYNKSKRYYSGNEFGGSGPVLGDLTRAINGKAQIHKVCQEEYEGEYV
jgi:hypothetical protein